MSIARLVVVASIVIVMYGLVAAVGQQTPEELDSASGRLQALPGDDRPLVDAGSPTDSEGQVYSLRGIQWIDDAGSLWGLPIEYQALGPGTVSQTGEELGALQYAPSTVMNVPGGLRPLTFPPNTVIVKLTEKQRDYVDHLVATAQKMEPDGNWNRSKVVSGLIDSAMREAGHIGDAPGDE